MSKWFRVWVFRFQCLKTALLTPDTWDQKVGIKDDLLLTALIYTPRSLYKFVLRLILTQGFASSKSIKPASGKGLAKHIWNLLQLWTSVDHCFDASVNACVQRFPMKSGFRTVPERWYPLNHTLKTPIDCTAQTKLSDPFSQTIGMYGAKGIFLYRAYAQITNKLILQ